MLRRLMTFVYMEQFNRFILIILHALRTVRGRKWNGLTRKFLFGFPKGSTCWAPVTFDGLPVSTVTLRHLHISHNAPYLPPSPLPKFYISIVFNFAWDGCNTQEKWKTKVMKNLGTQITCASWEMCKWRILFKIFIE